MEIRVACGWLRDEEVFSRVQDSTEESVLLRNDHERQDDDEDDYGDDHDADEERDMVWDDEKPHRKETMSQFAEHVVLKKKLPGKIAAFACVQFKTGEAAEKALPKDTYETAAQGRREQLKSKVEVENEDDMEEGPTSSGPKKGRQPTSTKFANDSDDEDEEMSEIELKDDSGTEEERTMAKRRTKIWRMRIFSEEDDDQPKKGASVEWETFVP
ncbi:unnamed protein product [Nippostrongylus brasiliensis]|uniref:Nucleolin-like n=1 Tax=Nippostrongylus brasiliensis TaxID=27835 RepID=A0A0N4XZ18_NIPBR|nr:unnamed protein product [Nippostrongylus brasiliensis]